MEGFAVVMMVLFAMLGIIASTAKERSAPGKPTLRPGDKPSAGNAISPRIAQARAELMEPQDESALDLDERVRREVGRRLDTLQADRDAFMAFDKDGDGLVNAEEWEAARASVEAEVRAELGEDDSATAEAQDDDSESAATEQEGEDSAKDDIEEPSIDEEETAAAPPDEAPPSKADESGELPDGHW